jgi:hypothetical protein
MSLEQAIVTLTEEIKNLNETLKGDNVVSESVVSVSKKELDKNEEVEKPRRQRATKAEMLARVGEKLSESNEVIYTGKLVKVSVSDEVEEQSAPTDTPSVDTKEADPLTDGVSVDDVRELCQELIQKKLKSRQEIMAKIKEFGRDSITQMDQRELEDFYEEMEAFKQSSKDGEDF